MAMATQLAGVLYNWALSKQGKHAHTCTGPDCFRCYLCRRRRTHLQPHMCGGHCGSSDTVLVAMSPHCEKAEQLLADRWLQVHIPDRRSSQCGGDRLRVASLVPQPQTLQGHHQGKRTQRSRWPP